MACWTNSNLFICLCFQPILFKCFVTGLFLMSAFSLFLLSLYFCLNDSNTTWYPNNDLFTSFLWKFRVFVLGVSGAFFLSWRFFLTSLFYTFLPSSLMLLFLFQVSFFTYRTLFLPCVSSFCVVLSVDYWHYHNQGLREVYSGVLSFLWGPSLVLFFSFFGIFTCF